MMKNRRESYRSFGSFDQAMTGLFSHVKSVELQQLQGVLDVLRRHGKPVHRGLKWSYPSEYSNLLAPQRYRDTIGRGSKIVITGSSVKRLHLGTPPGWQTPGKLAREMMMSDPVLQQNDLLHRIGDVGPNDLDLRIDITNGESADDIYHEIAQVLDSDTVFCEHKTFGISHLFRLTFASGWIVDIGMLAREDFRTNCRTSTYLPWSEAFSVVFIDRKNRLYSDAYEPEQVLSDEAFLSFSYATSFPQAFIALLRVRLNTTWWDVQVPDAETFRIRVSQVASQDHFWDKKIQRTEAEDFESRMEEVNTGILLYLLLDPWRFLNDARIYHFLGFMKLSDYLSPDILEGVDPVEYREKFDRGTLPLEQSGLHLLARRIGKTPAETLELLKLDPIRLHDPRM